MMQRGCAVDREDCVTEAWSEAAADQQGSTHAALKLGIAWHINSTTGWGALGLNLARELLRLPNSHVMALANDPAILAGQFDSLLPGLLEVAPAAPGSYAAPFPVFHALAHNDLLRPKSGSAWEGSPNIGLAVFEFDNIVEAGRRELGRYERLVALSKWARDRLEAAGAKNVMLWRQGVDLNRFHPAPRHGRAFPTRFVVFSGGTFLARKAQDIVVAAFRRFHRLRPDAVLLAAWTSQVEDPWPVPILRAGHVKTLPPSYTHTDLHRWLLSEGLPKGSFIALPHVPNIVLAERLRQCDVALFPNRAEGATNFLAMEAIASGVPTILSSNTGHLDLIEQCPSVLRLAPRPLDLGGSVFFDGESVGVSGWGESDVDEIVHLLSEVYDDPERGRAAATEIADWSWPRQTERLLSGLGLR
jgi:glycosyltransferase involved in cell wall biosynthesis